MKTGGFTRFWAVFVTLVLIAVAILAAVWFTDGTLTYNKNKVQDETETDAETVAVTEDGSALESGSTVPMQNMSFATARSLAAYSSDAAAQSEEYASVELTATLSPDWVAGDLSWSIAFNNPASEWATGKTVTDYVTLTPGETALTATVQCLQPFGEQIVVTVSADEFEGVSASCTVDFGARIKTLLYKDNQNLGSDGNGIDLSTAEYIVWDRGFEEENTFTITPVYYTHTVESGLRFGSGSPTLAFIVQPNSEAARTPQDDGLDLGAGVYTNVYNNIFSGSEITESLSNMTWNTATHAGLSDEEKAEMETWLSVYAGITDYYSMRSSIENDYSSFSFNVPLRLNASKFEATVDLGLDDTGIVV